MKFKTIILSLIAFAFFSGLESKAQSQKPVSKPKYEYSTPELKSAEALYKNKKYPEALAAFEDIIQKAQKAENYEEVVYTMEKKALSLRRLGRFDETIETMDKAIVLALEKLPKGHLLISKMYYTRGTTDHNMNKYYSARAFFDTAMVFYEKANAYDSFIHYRIIEYKFHAYRYSEGSVDTLLSYLDKLVELDNIRQTKYSNIESRIKRLMFYSAIYNQKGDFEQALVNAIQVYKLAIDNKSLVSQKTVYNLIYKVAKVLYFKKEYESVINIEPFNDSADEYHDFHNLLGSSYMALEIYEKALFHFKKALKRKSRGKTIFEKRDIIVFESQVLMNMGLCHQLIKKPKKAMTLIKESISSLKTLVSIPNENFHNKYEKLGYLYEKGGNWEKALVAYDSALRNGLIGYISDIEVFPNGENIVFSYKDLSTLLEKAKVLMVLGSAKEDSISLLLSTQKHTEEIHRFLLKDKQSFSASEGKLNQSKDFKSLYQTGVHASFELYKRTNDEQYLDKGLTHMSRGKAQLFLEQMGDMESLRGRDVPEELRTSFALASQKIDSLDIEVSTLLNIDPLDERLPPVLEERIQWNDQLDSMKKVVSTLHKAPEKEVSVDILRQQYNLNSDKAFVEFIDGDSLIFAIGVSGDKTSFRKIKKDGSFKVALAKLLKEVSVAPQGAYTEHLNNFGQSASTLYQSLVAPIVDDLGSVKELIIVPDGELTKLPFDLLVSDWTGTETSFKELNYLLKEVNITHLLSSKIEFDKESNSVGKGILGFGYVGEGFTDERAEMGNLPGALEEIDFLKAKFDGDYFTGEKGTKQEFLKQADDYDIIHLAIHGKSDSTNRFKSSLVFNGDKDYYLTSTDLYSTNLQSKLAVLSACETGVGQLSKGEGTFSIARGFAIAGVPAIVTTLWKVNDIAGAKITQAFYQGLEQGFNKDEALRKAKLSFLEQSNNITESPFYWGNYILIGDPVPIELKKKDSSIQWVVLMGVLLLAVGVVASKRRKKLSHAA